MIPTPRMGISEPSVVIQTHSSRAGPGSVPFVQHFLLHFVTNSMFSVILLHCHLPRFSSRPCSGPVSTGPPSSRLPDGRRITCEPERRRHLTLAVVLEYRSAEALELALVTATIRGHATHVQVPHHRTSTGLGWLITGTIIRT
jgi:hypothetical protein